MSNDGARRRAAKKREELATLRADLARVTAERDRMRPVVEAAVKLSHHHGAMVTLSDAVDDYLDAEPKEGTRTRGSPHPAAGGEVMAVTFQCSGCKAPIAHACRRCAEAETVAKIVAWLRANTPTAPDVAYTADTMRDCAAAIKRGDWKPSTSGGG